MKDIIFRGVETTRGISDTSMTQRTKKECTTCDFKNAIRYGRADHRCPNCGKQLMLEMVLMQQAGIDYKKITPKKTKV